ncbi:Inner membrane ABC transporter permease protein YdcV [bioreactor metagenome]|uniref:Inner membrane ABC transporter permease protein YdcV n=1 Tax=bioreactor metagenome TaxID=1076179 RepID=A0A645B830_9ZZZZ
MVLAVLLGTLIAFGMYKYKFKGKNTIDTLFYIPIIIPEIVLGIALMTMFSILSIGSGMKTLIIAHTTFCIPYVVFNVKASIAGFDHSVEEASMDLGANRIQTFYNITLPMIFPGIKSGAFMAFTLSIDDVIISYFTSGPGSVTLPIKVMSMVKRGITPDVNAMATIIMLIVLLMLIVSQLNIKERIKMRKAK